MAHIGVVTTSFPRYPGDHAGSFVLREVESLRAEGHRVSVVAPRSDVSGPRAPAVIEAATPQGVFYGPGAPERMARRPVAFALRAGLAVGALGWTALRGLRSCDALIAHWLVPSAPLAGWVSRGRPYGVMAHSAGAQLALRAPAPARAGLRVALRHARFVTCSEPGLAHSLSEMLDRPVGWVAARANLCPLRGIGASFTEGPLRLGFLGRRVPVKGLDILLQALEPMPVGVELHVAGPGAWVERPGVVDWGRVVGDDALRRFMSAVDVLVLPSRRVEGGRSEGLPCALLEAWAAGRPVLASRVGAVPAIVDPTWQFESEDVRALRAAILHWRDAPRAALWTWGERVRGQLSGLEEQWSAQRERDLSALLRTEIRC